MHTYTLHAQLGSSQTESPYLTQVTTNTAGVRLNKNCLAEANGALNVSVPSVFPAVAKLYLPKISIAALRPLIPITLPPG
jgi:hypothetical protein